MKNLLQKSELNRKLRNFITLCFVCLLAIGNAWGQGQDLVLTFNLSSNPGGWPTTNLTTLTEYTYVLDGTNYTFALKNVKCNDGYLMLTATAALGLPAVEDYKLTKVVAKNSGGCSTSVNVGVSSSASLASYISGGAKLTWATTSSSYTYNLSGTSDNTVYYLYVTNKNAQITSLELTYEYGSTTPTVATPTFTPAAGTYTEAQNVAISTSTNDATIYYTLGNSEPTIESAVYEAPITISATTTLKAVAVRDGYNDSEIATAEYTIVSAPEYSTISDWKAVFSTTSTVTSKLTGDLTFVYNNGKYFYFQDAAGTGLLVYDGNNNITREYNNGDVVSGGVYGTCTIYNGLYELVPTQDFPAGVAGTEVQPVEVTAAQIISDSTYESKLVKIVGVTFDNNYTFNDNHRSTTFTQDQTNLTCYNNFKTLAKAVVGGGHADVVGFVGCYNANKQIYPRNDNDILIWSTVATPSITPATTSFAISQTVTISCETDGATIYYTTNGEDPTVNSTVYSEPFSVMATTTVKAMAVKAGYENSAVATATYTLEELYTVTLPDQTLTETSFGAGVTLPSLDNVGDFTFSGWSTDYYAEEITTQPTIISAGEYHPTGDIMLYPIYTHSENGGIQWRKITDLSSITAGTYALLTTDGHAFNGTIKKGHGQVTTESFSFTDNVASTAPTGTCEIELQAVNGGYKMYNSDLGYLYASAASSGKLAWYNSEDSYWFYGSNNWQYYANSAYLRSYDNISIRTYGTNNGEVLVFAKKELAEVTYYTSNPVAQTTYTITLGYDTEGGDVTLSTTTAASGQTVTITVNPEDCYELDDMIVEDASGTTIQYNAEATAQNVYTFEMPSSNVEVTALFDVKNFAIDVDDNVVGGTIVANESADCGSTVQLLQEANSNYMFDHWVVTDAMGAPVTVENEAFTMPASDVTVSAVFEDIPTYTVTFDAGNGTCTTATAQYQLGDEALTLPTAEPSTGCVAQGWTFAGWTNEQIDGTTEQAPAVLLTNNYTPANDVTLHAVYAYTSGASSETAWEKATSLSIGDQVCLVCEGVLMKLDSISTTDTKYGVGTSYTDNIAGLYPMTIEEGNQIGSYAFKDEDGNYLYWNSGNSLSVIGTLSDNSSWTVSFDLVDGVPDNATIKNVATPSRQIIWNFSHPRFACYTGHTPKHSGTEGYNAVQLYKLTGGATTIYATSMNCNSCVIEAEDLPYTEDFEGYTTSTNPVTFVEPDCWTLAHEYVVKDPDTVPNLYYSNSTTFIHSGNYSLRMWLRDIYAMPKISEDIDIRTLKMTLWVRQSYSFYMLQVGVMSDLNDESTFVPVAVINNGTTQMEMSEVDFSQYVGDGRYIAFKNIGTSSSDSHSVNYIDDITLSVSDVACGISSLPYSENFDSYTTAILAKTGVQPNCWTIAHKDVAMSSDKEPQIYYSSSFAHESNYSLRMYGRCIYAMPKLDDNINVQDIRMSMYLRQPHSCYPLQVGVMSDLDDVNTYVPVTTIRNSSANVEHVTFDFSSYTGTGKYIVFRNVISGGSDPVSTNYIDDITLTQLDECGMITLPYQENFENMTTITTKATGIQPRCWAVAHEDVTLTNTNKPQLYYCSSFASSGNYTLRMYGRCIYAMPMLSDNVSVSDLTMGMYLRQPYACYPLQIGVMSDLDDASTFVPVTTIKIGGGNVQYVEVDFSSYTGEGKYIAFRNIISGGSDPVSTNYIDDININYTSEYTRALPFNMLVVNAPMDVEVEKFELSMELSQARAIENAMLENEVSIYPTPTTGEISIDASENVEKVEVYNNIGRLVATFNNQREINISDMPAGLYMLRVTLQGDAVVMKKVVKK